MHEKNSAEEANTSDTYLPEKHMTVTSLTGLNSIEKGVQILEDIDYNEERMARKKKIINLLRRNFVFKKEDIVSSHEFVRFYEPINIYITLFYNIFILILFCINMYKKPTVLLYNFHLNKCVLLALDTS